MAYSQNSSFDGADILEIIHQYERFLAQGCSFFFEADTFQEIIDYYDEHLNTANALEAIEMALKQHPYCAQFYLSKARIYIDQADYILAQEALDTARSYEPSNRELLLIEADLLQRTKRYDEALVCLSQVRVWADKEELQEADLLEVSICEARHEYAVALQKLERIALGDSDNDWLLSHIWICAEWANEQDKAIQIYQKVIDQNPYSCWAWYHLGYAYSELDLYEKAVEAFDYAIVIDEQFELAYRDIIATLLNLENYNEVLRYLNEYTNHFELDAEMYEYMGECYEGKGDSILARSYYIQSAQLNTRDGNSYFRLGGCYAKEKNWKSALSAFELAYQTNNTNELYCLGLAEAHYELEHYEETHHFLQEAIRLKPDAAYVWLSYIELLLYERDFEEAEKILMEAQMQCSDAFALNCGKAAILFMRGHFKACYNLLLQLKSENPQAAIQIAEICSDIESHPVWKEWGQE